LEATQVTPDERSEGLSDYELDDMRHDIPWTFAQSERLLTRLDAAERVCREARKVCGPYWKDAHLRDALAAWRTASGGEG
jgi:hypothetical protein